MKFPIVLLLVLGALSCASCVTRDPTVHVMRPGEKVKQNTFDDLAPTRSDNDLWLGGTKQKAPREHP